MRQLHFNTEQKRKIRKGFAWIHYEIIDDNRLNSSDIIVYLTLARFVDNETQECYPSKETLGKYTRLTEPTIRKSLYHLRDLGYIEIDSRKGKVNYYQLNDPQKNYGGKKKGITPKKERWQPLKKKGTNNTHSNNTNITNMSDKSDLEKKPFSYQEKLDEMSKDTRRHIQIISLYWKYKHYKFENEDQYKSALKRDMRAASKLKGYSDSRISDVMEWLEINTDIKWTLETVSKFIDDNLDDLAPMTKSKHKSYAKNY